MSKAIFLYPDNYDLTTATRRVLNSSKDLFSSIKIYYWARNGFVNEATDDIFSGIERVPYNKSAPPRSLSVLWLTIKFQFWLLGRIKKEKPDFISAFYFYTAFPALIYRYFFNRRCQVVYDPRDYVAVCYLINPILQWILRLVDNLFIRFADYVIFPDNQYFSYYGMFKLPQSKFHILPNSTEDAFDLLDKEDIFSKYKISDGKLIVPIIGYFSETRGQKLFYEAIEKNVSYIHFVVAGEFRDEEYKKFFSTKPNVTFLGKVTYPTALWLMQQAAIVPLLYDPASLNNKYAYPTKYYDSLMVGTPVLVSDGQVDVYKAVKEFGVGTSIEYNNTEEFLDVMEALRTNRIMFDREKIRKVFLDRYDFNLNKKHLRRFYTTVLKTK